MTTTRRAPARQQLPLTGGQLQVTVIGMAHRFQVQVAHFPAVQDSNGRWRTPIAADGKGWPDLFFIGLGGFMWREIKGARETLKPEQIIWIARLEAAGADVGVYRPADLHSRRIERELRALGRARPERPTP